MRDDFRLEVDRCLAATVEDPVSISIVWRIRFGDVAQVVHIER